MFEWCCGRRLWILLLPGKLNLRHRRNARNLRTLPAHSCYFQHWGERLVLSISPKGPPLPLSQHRTVLFICRAKPLWRKAYSASLRESHPRFSRRSAAATFSRGWSQRSVSEKCVADASRGVVVLTAFCLVKGAGGLFHQSWHLHRGTDQPRYHRGCGAGAHSFPQQVRNAHSKWEQTWKMSIKSHSVLWK